MVGQQKLALGQQRQGGNVCMVGVTMREPMVLSISDRLHLLGRNFVVQTPTPKISVAVDPSIGCQHRPIIIGNYDRGADGLKEAHT